jgi:hypothetical protein
MCINAILVLKNTYDNERAASRALQYAIYRTALGRVRTMAPCASMGFTKWEFDRNRNIYYYYDPDKSSYVYADGREIPAPTLATGYLHAFAPQNLN